MSWTKAFFEHLGEAVEDVVVGRIHRRLNEYLYGDERDESAPEDDLDFDPPPDPDPDPDYRGPDIPLHFNAPPGEDDGKEW